VFGLHFALSFGRLTQLFVYLKFSQCAGGHYRMVDDSKGITWRLWHRELKAKEVQSLPADSLSEIIMFRLLCLVFLPPNLQYRVLQAGEILM
jgi:hypothetical protein